MILLGLASLALVFLGVAAIGAGLGELVRRAIANPVPDFSHPVWKGNGA